MSNQDVRVPQDEAISPLDVVERLPHERCPTCNINWQFVQPAKTTGADSVRCVECKAVYPLTDATIASLREQVERLTKDLRRAESRDSGGYAPDGQTWKSAMFGEAEKRLAAESRVSVLEGALKRARPHVECFASQKDTGWLSADADLRAIDEALHSLPVNAAGTSSDGGVEGHAAVPLEIPAQRSGASHDPLGDGSVKVGPHREDAAGVEPCPSEILSPDYKHGALYVYDATSQTFDPASPDTARVADREALFDLVTRQMNGMSYVDLPAHISTSMVAARVNAILSLLSKGARTEGGA